jgi:hypothetical protein
MSKSYALSTLAAPTSLSATLVEGGTLTVGTSYYYAVMACQDLSGSVTHSPPSNVVSVTTTDTHRSVSLSWTAIPGYTPTNTRRNAYHVLRNTTGTFTDATAFLIGKTTGTVPEDIYLTTTFTDNGGYTILAHTYFPQGLPTILISGGSSSDKITMYDIYEADVAGGWGVLRPAWDDTRIDVTASKRTGGVFYCHANIRIGYSATNTAETTYFEHINGAIIVYGAFTTGYYTYLYIGAKTNTYDAHPDRRVLLMVHGSVLIENNALFGHLYLYGLTLLMGGAGWEAGFLSWRNSYIAPTIYANNGSEIYDCDFPVKGNGYGLRVYNANTDTATIRGCRFGGAAILNNITLIKPKITAAEGLGLRSADNITVVEPTTAYSVYDIMWHTNLNQTIQDGTFTSHLQTDNIPWLYLGYLSTGMGLGGSMTFQYSLKIKATDVNGNALTSASVTIKDADGVETLATTDASGEYDAGYLTARILVPLVSKTGYEGYSPKSETTMIADGTLEANYKTPHTITFTKPGYQTKIMRLTMDKKRDEVVVMEQVKDLNFSGKGRMMT